MWILKLTNTLTANLYPSCFLAPAHPPVSQKFIIYSYIYILLSEIPEERNLYFCSMKELIIYIPYHYFYTTMMI